MSKERITDTKSRFVIVEMPSKELLEDFLDGIVMSPVRVVFSYKIGKFVRLDTPIDLLTHADPFSGIVGKEE